MKKAFILIILIMSLAPTWAQRILSLDSCMVLALRNNKQLNISKMQKSIATNVRKAARTQYLPKVEGTGAYQFMSREVSLLSKDQKTALSNIGTTFGNNISAGAPSTINNLVQQGVITPDQGAALGNLLGQSSSSLIDGLNQIGEQINSALRTDTRNIFVASVFIRQPLYMGGAITASNRIADIGEQIANNNINITTQATIYDIQNAYWTVISLCNKQVLAQNYLTLIKKLDADVAKMLKEGVATKADKLKIDVKVNEAEMAKTQVDNGVTLAKMLLCQLCGIPINEQIKLADEDADGIFTANTTPIDNIQDALNNRPEIQILENMVEISKQNVKLIRASSLPQVALVGGYTMSNPNVFNGFERKFSGYFNIGVMVHVPIFTWFEGRYKVNAAKSAAFIAELELDNAQDKIELQINQCIFKSDEASKRLTTATNNIEQAQENLRSANLAFKEGIIQSTDVMEAQTAWLQAQSQKIDAQIDVKLSQVNLEKALGNLQY